MAYTRLSRPQTRGKWVSSRIPNMRVVRPRRSPDKDLAAGGGVSGQQGMGSGWGNPPQSEIDAQQKEEDRYQDQRSLQNRNMELAENQELHQRVTDITDRDREFWKGHGEQSREEAFRAAMQGLASRDPELIEKGMRDLLPQPKDLDVKKDGKGTEISDPRQRKELPRFEFDPSGVVQVHFPGQEKPAVFGSVDEAFAKIIAPLNPKFEADKALDRQAAEKIAGAKKKTVEPDYGAAQEYATDKSTTYDQMGNPIVDQAAYDTAYKEHIRMQTGGQPDLGEAPPVEGARKAPDGNWYIQDDQGQYRPVVMKGGYLGKGEPQGPPDQRRPAGPPLKAAHTQQAEPARAQPASPAAAMQRAPVARDGEEFLAAGTAPAGTTASRPGGTVAQEQQAQRPPAQEPQPAQRGKWIEPGPPQITAGRDLASFAQKIGVSMENLQKFDEFMAEMRAAGAPEPNPQNFDYKDAASLKSAFESWMRGQRGAMQRLPAYGG